MLPLTDREKQTITLSDGRILGFAEYGKPNGYPVLYFHGFPGSRMEGKFFEEGLQQTNLRFICTDRPGIGLSSIQSNRTLHDWAKDIQELVRHLNISKYALFGLSGGVPYALACAYYGNPANVVFSLLISGIAPIKNQVKYFSRVFRIGLWLAKNFPNFLAWIIKKLLAKQFQTPEKSMKNIIKHINDLRPEDKALFSDERLIPIFAGDYFHAFIQGSKGSTQDLHIYSKPWGFDLKKISTDIPIYIAHGMRDQTIPIEMSQYLEAQFPHSVVQYYQDEAHFSGVFHHLHEFVTLIEKSFTSRIKSA
jgi:pimeloyl-ACP methyl ester carboxylesterase